MADACATCASSYSRPSLPASGKPILVGRELPCCGRSICTRCLQQNERYETYCPYCQITTVPSALPQGLRDPPAYSAIDKHQVTPPSRSKHDNENDLPPAYSEHQPLQIPATTSKQHPSDDDPAPDVLHFVTPNDSIPSLSLAYDVPIRAICTTNNIFADGLLQGRRTILIPGKYYKGGVSLSPRPAEGEEEEARKQKVRRWMMACKEAEYDVAALYLHQHDGNLDAAVQAYLDDAQWEREHPLEEGPSKNRSLRKGKQKTHAAEAGMRRFVGVARS